MDSKNQSTKTVLRPVWLLLGLFFVLVASVDGKDVGVPPSLETEPVPYDGDAADDPAIWIHPTDRNLSTIIGTDKQGGLAVYDLNGNEIQYLSLGPMNNVDVRYNFPLGGSLIDIVAATHSDTDTILLYRVNPETRQLEEIVSRPIETNVAPLKGLCLYHSWISGKYYVFVTTYERGDVQQWELVDNGSGAIDAVLVRSFTLGSNVEGCVADDELSHLYLGQEDYGIWKYGAEPLDGEMRELVDSTNGDGYLVPEVEGLGLYMMDNHNGYLIASSQGNDEFTVYARESNDYLGTFSVVSSGSVDGVTHTDGLDVTSAALGDRFPDGIFVAQDHENTDPQAYQDFKIVSWRVIADALNLEVDSSWNPRAAIIGS
jgi:3-phytase